MLMYCQSELNISDGELIEGFENAKEWTLNGVGSYDSLNSNLSTQGNSALTLGTTSKETISIATKNISVNLKDYETFSIDLYLPEFSTKAKNFRIEFSSGDPDNTHIRADITAGYRVYKGWNRLVFSKSDFNYKLGNEDWANTMKQLRIAQWISNDTSSLTFDNLRGYRSKTMPVAIVTFDDGLLTQKTVAKPILDSLGIKATLFIAGVNINAKNTIFLRWSDIDSLYNEGYDISNHTYNHYHLTQLDSVSMEKQINRMHDTLIKRGYLRSADFFAYPYGDFDSKAVSIVKERHKLARNSNDWQFLSHPTGTGDDRYLLREHNDLVPLEEHRKDIDKAIERGQLLFYLFHDVSPYTGKFRSIMQYLKAKQDSGLIKIMTISQYWNALQKATKVYSPKVNIVTQFNLSQNYPNPFNPKTVINYELPTDGFISLKVYSILGQEVQTIFAGFQSAGKHQASFDASKLPSGVYLYKLQSGSNVISRKMILLQ